MGKMSALDCYLVVRLIVARRIRSAVSVVSVVSCVRVMRGGKRKTEGEVVMVGGGGTSKVVARRSVSSVSSVSRLV